MAGLKGLNSPERILGRNTGILAFFLCFVDISCRSTTAPDITPREITVTVKYIGALPITNPGASDIVSLGWSFPDESGSTDMPKVAENSYEVGNVGIITETVITINAFDLKIGAWVCKYLFVNGKELPTDSVYGTTTFILGNDGKVRKPG